MKVFLLTDATAAFMQVQ